MPTLLDLESGYSLWAETYPSRPHNELMRVEEEAMARRLQPLAIERALDLGTGTGRNLRRLRGRGTRIGLDRSFPMLKQRDAPGALFVSGDAARLPFVAGAFDLVLSSLMAGDLATLGPFTREAFRVLRQGGSLVYSDFHPIWAERRWERTFESSDGRTWRLPYHPHSSDAHRTAIEEAGLSLNGIDEPRLSGNPVLLLVHAVKR